MSPDEDVMLPDTNCDVVEDVIFAILQRYAGVFTIKIFC